MASRIGVVLCCEVVVRVIVYTYEIHANLKIIKVISGDHNDKLRGGLRIINYFTEKVNLILCTL